MNLALKVSRFFHDLQVNDLLTKIFLDLLLFLLFLIILLIIIYICIYIIIYIYILLYIYKLKQCVCEVLPTRFSSYPRRVLLSPRWEMYCSVSPRKIFLNFKFSSVSQAVRTGVLRQCVIKIKG